MTRLAWITGAGGLIGSHLVRLASECAPGWRLRELTRSFLDLADFAVLRQRFREDRPALVIHCAAISKSTLCQEQSALARTVNVEVTRVLAELAVDIPLIFFSTDLVFDGRKGAYVETDPVNPLSVYAETKVEAEQIVLRNPTHSAVRTSLNYGTSPTGDRAFNEQMRDAWRQGRVLRLFTDEYRSPIPAAITARAVWFLALSQRPGLYHLAGAERLSRWEIGHLIAAREPAGVARIQAASIKDYSGVPRPPDTTLNCSKLQRILPFTIPGFSAWVKTHAP